MEQMHLVIYLESHGCKEVRQDKNGMWVMRNEKTNDICGVPVPTSSSGRLKHTTVCSVCKVLKVPMPPSTPMEIQEMLDVIDKDIKKRQSAGK